MEIGKVMKEGFAKKFRAGRFDRYGDVSPMASTAEHPLGIALPAAAI
ncbi:MAG TPA: hypothetical protein VEF34_06110 [Syntrophobacteraceae bacterium]|nr:hypothetical protein [Syntrophobacteraceae bacterium]